MEPVTLSIILSSIISAGFQGGGMFMQKKENDRINNLARQDFEKEMALAEKNSDREFALGQGRLANERATLAETKSVNRFEMFNKMADRSFEMKYMLANGLFGIGGKR